MKKAIFFFCLFISPVAVFSQSPQNDFDYAIVFGGSFDKDIVSLKINNNPIFKNYKVDNRDSLTKGNLSLKQYNHQISINYNRNQKNTSRINFKNILKIEITVNNKPNKFNVDLRKGKILLIEFSMEKNAPFNVKKITIYQIQEPVLFI